MATLPTNLKDDILDASVNQRRRYKMITNPDGTVEFEDVTAYIQVGSEYGSGLINETNKQINGKVDDSKIVRDLKTIGAMTQEGFIPDALALKEVNESLANVSKNVYSTDEKVIGTWIDGKPLYRKVIEFSSFASGSMVDHNIPNIDHVHLGVGTCGTRSDGWILSNYFVNIAGADYLVQIVNKTQFHASYSGTYSKFIFVVEYTKTTD